MSGVLTVRIHAPRMGGSPHPWPSTNDLIHAMNANRYRGAQMKRYYTGIAAEYAAEAARQQGWAAPDAPVALWCTWYEMDRRRDPDNVHGGIKFALDGIVRAGLIRDDSQRWVSGIHHRIRIDKSDPGVEIVLAVQKEGEHGDTR